MQKKWLILCLCVVSIAACQKGTGVKKLYTWSKECSGTDNWYCHAECCNGYVQDGCIEDKIVDNNGVTLWGGDNVQIGKPETAQNDCFSYTSAVCQAVGSKPVYSKDEYYNDGNSPSRSGSWSCD